MVNIPPILNTSLRKKNTNPTTSHFRFPAKTPSKAANDAGRLLRFTPLVRMKFKFCADGDCPLWALAALHALGSLPAQLFRALLQRVLDDQPDDGIMEVLKDTSLASREECARAAAAVRWVVRSARACGCSGPQLARDLAVLGVPRAHAAALADATDEHRQAYVESVQAHGFTVNKLTDITASAAPAGTIDAYKLTLHSDNVAGEQKRELLIEKSQAKTLLEELKKAHKKLEELEAQG